MFRAVCALLFGQKHTRNIDGTKRKYFINETKRRREKNTHKHTKYAVSGNNENQKTHTKTDGRWEREVEEHAATVTTVAATNNANDDEQR